MKKLVVGVIYGGRSGEHEVSVLSGKNVISTLKKSNFTTLPIFIDKKGCWSVNGREVNLLARPGGGLRDKTSQKLLQVDIFFPVLHGTYGEDGTIQGLFEMAGVPYVGSGVLGSAVGMDKEAQKQLFLFHGLPTPQFEVVRLSEWQIQREEIIRKIIRAVGFPCFIKPANLGSSVGVNKAKNNKSLIKYINEAFRYDTKVIIEEFIKAREIDCAAIGPNDRPRVSLPGEIIPKRDFFDYQAKYISEETTYKFAVPLPERLKGKIMAMTAKVYKVTFCDGLARVEFLLTKSEDIFILEINTLPGMTSHSLFPRLWEASGTPFPQVIKKVIEGGWERHQKRKGLSTSYREGRLLE